MPLEEVVPPSASNGGKSREVTITHPDKVFWPKEGYTKADLVDYYRKIARWMLPYLKDRPVMIRALSRRHRGQELLSERRAGVRTRMDSYGDDLLARQSARHQLFRR